MSSQQHEREDEKHPSRRRRSTTNLVPTTFNFFAVDEVAAALSLSTRSVRRLIDDGKLPVHRFGRAVRIAEADLKLFLALHRED